MRKKLNFLCFWKKILKNVFFLNFSDDAINAIESALKVLE